MEITASKKLSTVQWASIKKLTQCTMQGSATIQSHYVMILMCSSGNHWIKKVKQRVYDATVSVHMGIT